MRRPFKRFWSNPYAIIILTYCLSCHLIGVVRFLSRVFGLHDQLRRPNHLDRGQPGHPARPQFRILEVDHVISRHVGGQENIENLQLLCAHCNRVKGDRPQEYSVARLRELGIAA